MSKPSMKDLREAGVNTALAPIAARLDSLKVGVRKAQELDSLAMKIAGVTASHRLKQVAEEVDRREQIFADAQASSGSVMGSPRVNALQSVLDDLVAGRYA